MPHVKIWIRRPRRVVVAAIAAIAFLMLTVAVGICAWKTVDPTYVYVVGAIWAVAPPVWF
jgi:hypothetical protein